MDGSLIDKYQYPCLDAPDGLVPYNVSINKHIIGYFVYPCVRYIRRNILLCIHSETKLVIVLEDIRNYSWVDTIKHYPHIIVYLEVSKYVEDLF